MATSSKRNIKENSIIDAAEKVFSRQGFANTKMEDVAKALGMSKGTIYFYFSSKENLYMAITYRAFQALIDTFYESVSATKDESGLEGLVGLMKSFIAFSEENFLYSEAMLDFISFVRSTSEGSLDGKITDAMKESSYYERVKDIQNIPINIFLKEIERGRNDGSILNKQKPELIYLYAWAGVLGFVKLNSTSGKKTTILKVEISDWRNYIISSTRTLLRDANA
ncbi:TetR/AcrR family transcriptional regulator [Portibacter lacus]|uniref:AcrR family transcriptional regulator n=1 Tax=Portibacter lacus TaxID=1099794 RepID=A0AA37SNS8_9BACT|nr:TetR/AcrR family transcriptional regulator [Portibacter lacus]GLR17207.1 AcrR family transcriptional regulator [Portibacter lacus]